METNKDVYQFNLNQFDESLVSALADGSQDAILEILEHKLLGVFTFKCMKPEFCKQLCNELEALERKGGICYKMLHLNY